MTQDQLIILLFKIVLLAAVVSVLAFVVQYTLLAKWWKNDIGRTLVVKDILLILSLLPTVMSLFFHFNRVTSHVAAWTDVVMFGLLTPCMLWRIRVWQRVHSRKDQERKAP